MKRISSIASPRLVAVGMLGAGLAAAVLLVTANAATPSAAGPAASLQTEPVEQVLNHYKCYRAKARGKLDTHPVRLKDQFVEEPVKVGRLGILCNPVRKDDSPVPFPDAHLTCYRIHGEEPSPPRKVEIRNQFGVSPLLVGERIGLCNPAAKSHPGEPAPQEIPTTVDHFKCYRAQGPTINRQVTLFDTNFLTTEIVEVHRVVLLCNPVSKNQSGVRHPEAHLVCYVLRNQPSADRTVQTLDQFGRAFVRVGRPVLLCVPSLKRIVD